MFSTPSLTTAFNEKPDQVSATAGGAEVTTLSAGATDAYATPAGSEPRWYAISAIIEGAPVLELNTVRAEASAGEPENRADGHHGHRLVGDADRGDAWRQRQPERRECQLVRDRNMARARRSPARGSVVRVPGIGL